MADLIQFAQDTADNLAAVILELGEPAYITDEVALVIGDGVTAVASLTRFTRGGPAFEALTASTAGTTSITMAAGKTEYRARATISAGAGAFTRKIALPITNRVAGHLAVISLRLPASANPTAEIRNVDGSGTLLFTIAGDAAAARNYLVTLAYTELGAWELWDAREIL